MIEMIHRAQRGTDGLQVDVPVFTIRHTEIGGTESAVYNLIKSLALTPFKISVAFANEQDLSPEFVGWLKSSSIDLQKTGIKHPSHLARFFQELIYEFLHPTDCIRIYPNYFLPPRFFSTGRRFVVLHDIQYKSLKQYHSHVRRIFLNLYLPLMFRLAHKVLVISEAERALVRKHFGEVAFQKCAVVNNSIDWGRYPEEVEMCHNTSNDPFVLVVAHPFPHKNLVTLLTAFNRIRVEGVNCRLVLVGKDSRQFGPMLEYVDERFRSSIRFTGFVTDKELGSLYRKAAVLALPSTYEGFGMPAVEAMGMGTPAVVSDIPALREVTLDSATYVSDFIDPEAWKAPLINAVLSTRRVSPEVVAKIRARYEPAAIAERMMEILCQ